MPACRAATWAGWRPNVKKVIADYRVEACRAAAASISAGRSKPCILVHWLGVGLVMAIVLVYLLIVVNFQSWLDPFIIITALPGALAGILWMLLLTHTTLECAVADRRGDVHGRGDGEQHPDGVIRSRPHGRRHGSASRPRWKRASPACVR